MKSNKIFKIIMCLVLGIVIAFGAVGCSNSKNNNSEDTVESIDIASTLEIDVGNEHTLQVSLMPFGVEATVTWKSSDTSVATVSDNGTVKGISAGTAVVRASAGGKYANCTVTVKDPSQMNVPVSKITLNIGYLKLDVDGTYTLTATVEPSNATDNTVTWSSSDTDVVTVTKTGEITAVSAGVADVTATSNSDSTKKATCRVIVAGGSNEGGENTSSGLFVQKVDALKDRDDFIMGIDASEVISI